MKKLLGQYMTPASITALVAQLAGNCDVAIDFAVGTGELLKAVKSFNNKNIRTIGFDIDNKVLNIAKEELNSQELFLGDGLSSPLPIINKNQKTVVVGNPPYITNIKTQRKNYWSTSTLNNLDSQLGLERSEIQFLCRSIATAKKFLSKAIIIMPISFADGDKYSAIRSSIMKNFYIEKCIELPSGVFKQTEARTVILVIDTATFPQNKKTEISHYDIKTNSYSVIANKALTPGARLDARYYSIKSKVKTQTVLSDLNVSIVRGDITNKAAKMMNMNVIHTSDFKKLSLTGGKLEFFYKQQEKINKHIKTIEEGDIILPRTGKRVNWEPIIISSGIATITDHVFRIRVPIELREIVQKSFFHPYFEEWLKATCKGVCATVLTKRELMNMPVFALETIEYLSPHKDATFLS